MSFEGDVQSTVASSVPVAPVVNGTQSNVKAPIPDSDPSTITLETGGGGGVGVGAGVGVELLLPPQPGRAMTNGVTSSTKNTHRREPFAQGRISHVATSCSSSGPRASGRSRD